LSWDISDERNIRSAEYILAILPTAGEHWINFEEMQGATRYTSTAAHRRRNVETMQTSRTPSWRTTSRSIIAAVGPENRLWYQLDRGISAGGIVGGLNTHNG